MAQLTLPELQKRFSIPNLVRVEAGENGLPKVVATAPGGTAEVYLHGAHVTQFQPKGERPVLMMSRKSAFAPDKPIRGGVPICWPWFGPRADDPKAAIHGFARLTDWDIESVAGKADTVDVVFSMHDTPATKALWPHSFKLRYTVTIARTLTLALETTNTDSAPFTITEAFHPYFKISDICNITIGGLENTSYSERIYQPDVQKQAGDPIRFTRRTDRVYYDTRAPIIITDSGLNRRIVERKENSNTTVIWNPWDEWPKTVPDFGEDEWPGMVCAEPSNAHHFGVTIKPGDSHTMRATIEVSPL